MSQTIDYYNKNAAVFTESTSHADMSELYDFFLKHLSKRARILDMGCGSGRDSKYFLEHGYAVKAIDASIELCKIATESIGQQVECVSFSDMIFEDEFDGIWACASLLHIPVEELSTIFEKCAKALKGNGFIYVSFKYGDFSGYRNERYFTDMTEESLSTILQISTCLKIVEMKKTSDVRVGRNKEFWLNVILQKVEHEHVSI